MYSRYECDGVVIGFRLMSRDNGLVFMFHVVHLTYLNQKMLEIDANSSLRLTVLIDVRAGHG